MQENLGAWSAFSPTPHNILVFGENVAHLHLFTVEIHGSLRWGQLRKESNYECFKVSQFLLSVSLFIHSKLTATCSWSVCYIFVWLYEIILLVKIVWNFTVLLILWYVVVSRLWVIYQKMKTLDLSLSRRIGYKKISAKCARKKFPILDDLNLSRWYYWVNSLWIINRFILVRNPL